MNEIDWIKSLDDKAARGVANPNVADSVLRTIRRRRLEPAEDSLAWPALLAVLTGSLAAAVAIQLIVTDPFTGFLDAFNLVLQ